MIGDMIKERRLELDLTQLQLSSLTNIKKNTISNYENNISAPNEENIIKLMDALKCDANYLFEWDKAECFKVSSFEKCHLKKYRTLDEYGKEAVNNVLNVEAKRCQNTSKQPIFTFRRLSENKASAGTGFDLNNPDEWQEIEVIDTPEARKADFAVRVEGASMEPDYYDGDIVYISLASEVPVGQVGLFVKDGKGYIKEAGNGCLISRNPDYEDVYPTNTNIECKGRVIGIAELP